ncbi:MAG: DPP IV N-terminal domain-containing protein [Pirellulaceae bacterium]|nr:DPP IV N-terminal domain-containing protein [Pirellulaceae bacterium]
MFSRLARCFWGWCLGLTLLGSSASWAQLAEPKLVSELKTVAESSGYRATANGADTELFLKRLHRFWSGTQLESLGQTVDGRSIWGLVVPPESGNQPVVTIMLLGGIHSGECDGKEALLALARDYASGKLANERQHVRLIFVPNFNADGNERVGLLHRPGQLGPESGTGIRENAQGLDLNRDFIKLETPEVRALVAGLNRWNVDVLIDTHTTNGSLHRYDLTYAAPNHPATPSAINKWVRDQLLPTVSEKLATAGMQTFYYGNFDKEHQQWKSYGHEPRYSTELMGLRGKIGILAESYSYATYQRRIDVTYAFVHHIIDQVNLDSAMLRNQLDAVASGIQAGQALPVQAELALTSTDVVALGYKAPDQPAQLDNKPETNPKNKPESNPANKRQPNSGLPMPPYNAQSAARYVPHDYRVDLWVSAKSTRDIVLPQAYAVSPRAAWALSRLKLQGIVIERLQAAQVGLPCESFTIEAVADGQELQKHKLRRTQAVIKAEVRTLDPGTYIVRTDQPLGKLAAYLLEPESEDGLAAWNFFDPDLAVGQAYPVVRVMAPLPVGGLSVVREIEPGELLTLEHILKPGHIVEYSTTSQSGATWLEGTNDLVLQRDKQWLTVDPATGASRPNELIQQMQAAFGKLEPFQKAPGAVDQIGPSKLSANLKYGLHEHENDLYLFDAALGTARRLTETPKAAESLAQLSPTGSHVAYVQANDLYVIDCATGQERRLTKDGSTELLNGILDWVYQEEIYGRGQFRAFWFSPDGQRLAFLQLDQTPVHRYAVSDSIHYRQELEETRYPTAGDPLPVARMWLAEVNSGQLREIDLSNFPADDRLVVRVTWSPDNELWLQIQNRIQNEQSIVQVDLASCQVTRRLFEKSPGWIEVLGQPKFLPGGDFLWLSDLPAGRRHLHRFDRRSGMLKPLTKGDWDVSELQAVTADGQAAFVSGNYSNPVETSLLRVDTQSGQTTVLTKEPGVHRTQMSEDGQYMLDSWSSLTSPPRTVLKSLDGQVARVLGAPVSDRYQYVKTAKVQLTTIQARDGLELQTLIMLPEASGQGSLAHRRLPVLFHVYAGPQAPTVNNAWAGRDYWWHQYLCSQGYAVVLCDNRASRGRGIADTWKIYRDMGRVELQDIEDAVAWVGKQPWADPSRVGIWGWSYGGYMTAYALTHSQSFKAGISGAPVTDWRNYDAIYTERYMDLPQKNAAGYVSSSAVEAASQLHGRLLLLHGERDDNVHISNTLQLAYALQKAGKPFDMMVYPKNRHGIVDQAQRYHMYQKMTEFLEQHLKN